MYKLREALESIPLKISHHLVKKSYRKGTHIIQSRVENDYLFFLIEGHVEVIQFTYEGREILIEEYRVLDVFGELEIFDKVLKTNAVVAKVDCIVMKLHRDFVFEWIKIDQAFSTCLFEIVVHRYIQACSRASSLATLTIKQRLLLNILRHHEMGDLQWVEKNKLIREIGVPKRSLNRILKECCEEGYVKYSEKQFSIIDLIKLKSFVSTLP